MAIKITDEKSQKSGYGVDVFKEVNKRRSGGPKSKMKTCAIKMYPEEREALEELFVKIGLSFSSGVRHVLTEYKNKNS